MTNVQEQKTRGKYNINKNININPLLQTTVHIKKNSFKI